MTPNEIICRCSACNGEIQFEANRAGETVTCPHCAMDTQLYVPGSLSRVAAPPAFLTPAVPPPRVVNDAGETVFLHEGGFYVTNARFVAGTQTFSIANIASVQAAKKSKGIVLPLLSLLLSAPSFGSAFALPSGQDGSKETTLFLFGLWFIASLIVTVRRFIPEYQLRISTSGATINAFESRNRAQIARVTQALNEAIIVARR